MARIEKTVFISYRRKDISWALAVYQYLASQKYDVFFDFNSIPSGDFDQIILSNIRARAHFILILTPTALDRCSEPGDWLRREIETALKEKRNIVPLFFDDFNFGSPSIAEKVAGPLAALSRYNGLNIPSGYFMEAMDRMRSRYLNVPLNAVLHPVSREVQEVVKKEQTAANTAVLKRKAIEERVKSRKQPRTVNPTRKPVYLIGALIFAVLLLGIFGANYLLQSIPIEEIPTSKITSVPTLGIGSTMISPKDGMVMAYVPGGEFIMGSDVGNPNETPVHTVYLDAFWMDQTEITNGLYQLCVQAGKCQPPQRADSLSRISYYGNSDYDSYPVTSVNWHQAKAYCEWAGARLPTEAEWEKAARGTTAVTYPWGNSAPSNNLLNYNKWVGDTTQVGQFPEGSSPYGLQDMAGNVWEWVADWHGDLYSSQQAASNPQGPASGKYRVVRGGSWESHAKEVRTTCRDSYDPEGWNVSVGFRCAMDASE